MKLKKALPKPISVLASLFIILGMMLFMIPGTILAQDEDEFVLEDVLVTATKTGETELQETPVAISVFNDEMLGNLSSFNLEDVSQFVPGVEIRQNNMGIGAFIRGIGTPEAAGPNDHNVSFYIDGIYLHQGRGAWTDFMDVERIEIMKGPQGTLYGRDSTGGTINIITKLPSNQLEFSASVDVGDYSHRKLDAMISGPLVKDKLLMRLAVSDGKHDGYIENLTTRDLRDMDYTGFRGSLQFIASDKVDIVFRGDYRDAEEARPDGRKLLSYGPPTDFVRQAQGIPESVFVPADFYTVNRDVDSWRDEKIYGYSGELNIRFSENMNLKYLGGYRMHDIVEHYETDGSLLFWDDWNMEAGQEADWWTHEANLTATWGRLETLFGAYYFDSDQFRLGPAVLQINPMMGVNVQQLYETTTLAAFAQFKYAFTDRLTATAGIRYSDEEKNNWTDLSFWLPPTSMLPGAPPPSITEAPGDWTSWTPKFGLDYRASEDLFVYASASKGFRGGIPSVGNIRVGYPPVTEPETVWTYELGMKSDWLERRLRVNGALFYNDYTDYQTSMMVVHPEQGAVMVSTNAGGADVYGIELEVVGRPTPALTLNAGLTYLDHEYVDFTTTDRWGDNYDVSGNPLIFVPDLSASLGANYVVSFEDAGYLTFNANVSYRDEVTASAVPDPLMIIEDYTLVNARVRYESEGGHWSVEAYGKNLFEEEYFRHLSFDNDRTRGQAGDPRTYGIKVTYKYF